MTLTPPVQRDRADVPSAAARRRSVSPMGVLVLPVALGIWAALVTPPRSMTALTPAAVGTAAR